ncbi:MAG: beta-ketoacyl-ACP synthase II [candidate division Zixibacteria bacterium]|nr:beta-ketoacyl-ACP synthase II [candidate division Zixibacteria bacterium]
MEKRRVVITGIGVVAPNGIGIENFWDSVVHGRSGIKKISHFNPSSYPSQIAGEVNDFNPLNYMSLKSARRMDRFSQFAVACSRMALDDARLEINKSNSDKIGIALGSALGGIPNAEEQHSIFLEKGLKRVDPLLATKLFLGASTSQVSIELGINGHSNTIAGACSVGTDSIGYAYDAIKNNFADIMVTGGSEAPLAPLTFGAFCLIGALSTRNGDPTRASRPFDIERDGFVMSEGAGILILEDLENALERGISIYAEVLSYATTNDAYNMVQPLPDGEQAKRAIQLALQNAGIKPNDVDYINAHGTSTPLNDKIETTIIKEIFGEYAYKIPISSIKSMIGHTLGAAGAIEAIASVLTIKYQYIPPTINYEIQDPECDLDYVPNRGRKAFVNTALTSSYGFGGKNSAIILRKFHMAS